MTGWRGAAWRGRTMLAVGLIPPLVHLVPLNRLTRLLAAPARLPNRRGAPDDPVLAAWVDRLLRRAPWPWRHTCLKRAAVLYYLLGRAGRPVELGIGVRRGPGDPLTAHAWLERDGIVILEPPSSDVSSFKAIARFPEVSQGPS